METKLNPYAPVFTPKIRTPLNPEAPVFFAALNPNADTFSSQGCYNWESLREEAHLAPVRSETFINEGDFEEEKGDDSIIVYEEERVVTASCSIHSILDGDFNEKKDVESFQTLTYGNSSVPVVDVDAEKAMRASSPQSASRGAGDGMEEVWQILKDKHGTQYLLLLEMKRTLDVHEFQLKQEQEALTKVGNAEQAKMLIKIERVENQRKILQGLLSDYHKMRSSKDESEDKIKELTEQLLDTKLEMSKRISHCENQQKKLEERVKTLEKENKALKKQKRTMFANRTAWKRPLILPQPPSKNLKRIQFADDVASKENGPGVSKTSAGESKPSANSGYVVKGCDTDTKTGQGQGSCDPNDRAGWKI